MRDRLARLKGAGPEVLDWLILSGKTCNLGLVRRVLEREFGQPPAIRWNPDRVTFVPEYAKLATSVGACYAQMVRLIVPDVSKAEEILQGGRNQLRFQINNLFWFLPCSFLLVADVKRLPERGSGSHQDQRLAVGQHGRLGGDSKVTPCLRRRAVVGRPRRLRQLQAE